MHLTWVRGLRDQCRSVDLPFFFKQWGEWIDPRQAPDTAFAATRLPRAERFEDGTHVWRVGKRAAGRHLDGRTWDEIPLTPAVAGTTECNDEDHRRQQRPALTGA